MSTVADSRFVTVKEFAARTGHSEKTIRKLVRRGDIASGRRRGLKPGKGVKILIPESEINNFIRMEAA
ncbi:helix-turn-helix transcriptional regulator [Corynebacterium sanguinis]|uniref:helix-turn-helix transcriptional regulator n=1 Tax=Corynebacterium sanguinis TaxID=2594913 RepID=UPI0021A7EE48|nr:helix-turn-helix domain-containing protein [Corynebacterium sanguinis]MCT1463368.1 helix-turn-helix domain-containing protein [Corynebacterium sanguinis]MCT2329986.1 helix-turn-helix domain-containing protein [Corynebacterium sanguinis]